MGQPVTVIKKKSSHPDVVRFELNRSISGMGHERYTSVDDADGDRPVDRIARQLLETGGVDRVHINSNVITLDINTLADLDALEGVIGSMFTYYRPGVEVPSFEPAADEVEAATD
jgi:CTP:molybdopterin cytidylyltransferase MocA